MVGALKYGPACRLQPIDATLQATGQCDGRVQRQLLYNAILADALRLRSVAAPGTAQRSGAPTQQHQSGVGLRQRTGEYAKSVAHGRASQRRTELGVMRPAARLPRAASLANSGRCARSTPLHCSASRMMTSPSRLHGLTRSRPGRRDATSQTTRGGRPPPLVARALAGRPRLPRSGRVLASTALRRPSPRSSRVACRVRSGPPWGGQAPLAFFL